MKILFVSGTYSNYFSIDDIVRTLYKRGHTITLIAGMTEKRNIPDDALKKAKLDLPNLVVEPLLTRRHFRSFAKNIRELLNYAHVLKQENRRRWDAAKWSRFFPPLVWRIASSQIGRKKLKDNSFQRALRSIEQKIPLDYHIRAQVQQCQPDIVIVMPLINPDSRENEYVKTSLALNIPCVYSMVSWDNIASKGTFHSKPNYSIVWNESLARELTELHKIPRDRILITGAPRFDKLLDQHNEYIFPKSKFCELAGLDENKKYILYVCSTFLVNKEYKKELNESDLILEIANALEKNPQTQAINILVRPHPTDSGLANKIQEYKKKHIHIYPVKGEIPDTEEKRTLFYNSIYHSIAVVGVNTTAFLEASTLDKPCITIVTEKFKETQQLPHFHHLAEANFLETAHGMEDLVETIGKIINGTDTRTEQRHEFVKKFIRPHGLDKPAAEIYANTIEKIRNEYTHNIAEAQSVDLSSKFN